MKRRLALWLMRLSVKLGGSNPDEIREKLREQISVRMATQKALKDANDRLFQVEECCFLIMRNAIRFKASRDQFCNFGEGTNHFVQHLWDRAHAAESGARWPAPERDIRDITPVPIPPEALLGPNRRRPKRAPAT